MERAISMELALVEMTLVDNAIGEAELADALRPALFGGTNEVTA